MEFFAVLIRSFGGSKRLLYSSNLSHCAYSSRKNRVWISEATTIMPNNTKAIAEEYPNLLYLKAVLYKYSEVLKVEFEGPPPVSTCGSVNIWNEPMVSMMNAKKMILLSEGIVM